MCKIGYSLIQTPGVGHVVTVVIPGVDVSKTIASEGHPAFKEIVATVTDAALNDYEVDDPQELIDLFDTEKLIEKRFERLSVRVTVKDGVVLIDGDPAKNAITEQILRLLDDGEDLQYLVNFYEKLLNNPNDHSREQAYSWLNAQQASEGLTITPDGDVVAYKGVAEAGGKLLSKWAGKAIVTRPGAQPETVEGKIPNDVGNVVEMPRSEVVHEPGEACSTGLHVGTFSYARTYASGGKMLKVVVDPRDFVSVPNDASGQKARVCRYRVLDVIDAPVSGSVQHEGYVDGDEADPDGDLDVTVQG